MVRNTRPPKTSRRRRRAIVSSLVVAGMLAAGGAWAGLSQSTINGSVALAQTDGDDDDDEVLTEGEGDRAVTDTGPRTTGTPAGGGRRITNLSPDLRLASAEARPFDLNDNEEEFVMFEFEDFVRAIADERGFELSGPSTRTRVRSVDARLVQGATDQVLVAFAQGTDLNQFTIATVDVAAVQDEKGQGNLPTTVPLEGTTTVRATASASPTLESISFNTTLDRATYEFDRKLDEGNTPSASSFGFTTFDGREVEGRRIISIEEEQVIVEFDDQVDKAVRFFARGAAVDSNQGIVSVPGSIGQDTTSPDIVDVSRVDGERQFDFQFSQAVANPDPRRFEVFDDAGQRFIGADSTRVNDETVRVLFPDIEDFTDSIAIAAVDSAAVESNDGSFVGNTVGSVVISDSRGARLDRGMTAGPDLENVLIDTEAGQVLFEFNKLINDDIEYDPGDFWVITVAGDLVSGRTFIDGQDNHVMITFDKNVIAAEDGFVLSAGAVQDHAGNESPPASIDGGRSGTSSSSRSFSGSIRR